MTIDSNGTIYGTTEWGGTTRGQGSGTVFKLAPSGSGYKYAVIYRFKDNRDGAWRVGSVLIGNGVLYGARNTVQAMRAQATRRGAEPCTNSPEQEHV